MEIFDDKVKEFIMNASEKLVAREGKLSGLSREEHLRLKVNYLRDTSFENTVIIYILK